MSVVRLVVVVTGMSGAGKSTALRALEDLEFFCIDNLPTPVIPETIAACESRGVERVALGIDVRVRSFLDRAAELLPELEVPGERALDVVFLDASDESLLRRFSSTRRPHPLNRSSEPLSRQPRAVLDGVRVERERLATLRANAKHVIDTTELSVHDLRRRILSHYGPGVESRPGMRTRLISFGFKYGMPVDADVVFDVRFVENPYFVEALRPLTGLDESVKEYVFSRDGMTEFMQHATSMLEFLLPRYEKEGKSYLTVAIGCTGGMHRSVAVTEALADHLRDKTGLHIDVVHRDIKRDTLRDQPSRGQEVPEPGTGSRHTS